jgi:hypothetical protein
VYNLGIKILSPRRGDPPSVWISPLFRKQHSPPWEAYSTIFYRQEITHILWNMKFIAVFTRSCQMDPIHTVTSCPSRFIIIIFPHLCLGLLSGLFTLGFPTKCYMHLYSPCVQLCYIHLILLDFVTIIFGKEYSLRVWRNFLLGRHVLHFHVYFLSNLGFCTLAFFRNVILIFNISIVMLFPVFFIYSYYVLRLLYHSVPYDRISDFSLFLFSSLSSKL